MSDRRLKDMENSNSEPPAERGRLDRLATVALIILGFTIVMVSLFGLLWIAGTILLVLFAGILLALALRGISDTLAKKTGIGNGWSLAIVLVVLVLALGMTGLAMAPSIAAQFQELTDQLPRALEEVYANVAQYEWGRTLLNQVPNEAELLSPQTGFLGYLPDFFHMAVVGLITVILVLFIGLYLAAEPEVYVRGLRRLFPSHYRPRLQQVLDEIASTLRRWLLGRVFSMAVVGVMVTVGLWLLGIPLALILGLFAALMEIIPNFGPLLAAIPGILIAFLISPELALYVIIMYLVVQTIEPYLLTPLVQRYTVCVPPVMTLLAQVVMVLIFGVLGLLLAGPLAAVILVLVKMLYVQQTLGEEVELFRGHKPEQPAISNCNIVLGSEDAAPLTPKS